MGVSPVNADDPRLLAHIIAYRRRWGLGDAFDLSEHLATTWKAMWYDGRMVAVFGERQRDGGAVLEVSDAYCEPTRFGRVAAYAMFLGYAGRVDRGEQRAIRFSVHYRNVAMWTAVVRELKIEPVGVVFEYEGKHG